MENLALKEELEIFLKNNKLRALSDISSPKWKDKLKLKCLKCSTEFEISIQQLLRPHPERTRPVCPLCNSESKFIDMLKEKYGKVPYKFLTPFKGYSEELTVKCIDCDFEFVSTPARLLMNSKLEKGDHPCAKCTKIRKNSKKDINELTHLLEQKFGACNYEFPHPELYAGLYSKEKFEIKCKKCGHTMFTYINNILNPKNGSHYCRVCNSKDRLLETMSYKERCLKVTGGKIEPIEDYIDSKTPIRHKCNICGYGVSEKWYKIPVKNTTKNAGCPKCAKMVLQSNAEKEILDFILSIYSGDVLTKDRTVLSGKELDIYIPELSIAFEVDGLYWHSEEYKGKKYHIEKTLECHKKGIRLIHIFDDEWYQKQEIVKMKISTILGKNSKSIYARKCTFGDVEASEKNKFLEKYHIQGKDTSAFSKGLYYNGELVAVMTICRLRRCLGNKTSASGVFELSRFATKMHIVGAFSKLLKEMLKEHPEIQTLTTFADIRWSSIDKNVYTSNGFIFSHMAKPNYWYFDTSLSATSAKRIHRFNFRKDVLEKKFPDLYKPELKEMEIMDKTQYRRIWDCGNIKYIYTRKEND